MFLHACACLCVCMCMCMRLQVHGFMNVHFHMLCERSCIVHMHEYQSACAYASVSVARIVHVHDDMNLLAHIMQVCECTCTCVRFCMRISILERIGVRLRLFAYSNSFYSVSQTVFRQHCIEFISPSFVRLPTLLFHRASIASIASFPTPGRQTWIHVAITSDRSARFSRFIETRRFRFLGACMTFHSFGASVDSIDFLVIVRMSFRGSSDDVEIFFIDRFHGH